MISPRSPLHSPRAGDAVPAHQIFTFDNIIFSSNFDNGNLGKVERVPNKPYDFRIWTAPDNMGTEYQSKHCAWFHFVVSGLPMGCVLRIQVVNASNHSGLYKFDMRPVYRSNITGQKWIRIKSSVRFSKEESSPQLFFEHGVECADDKIYFAFTYPYSYSTLQNELAAITHENNFSEPDSMFYQRELLTLSRDGRRVDLLTITSVDGASAEQEPLLSGLFPDSLVKNNRPPAFPQKEVIFMSARVHAGEVPAQHTFKGILGLLLDKDDLRAKALRARYVFKLIPMLNPDGVYRGHFRMDQLGQNLNRYYSDPDPTLQPAIFAARALTDYYAGLGRLSVYMDFHAHASKRGCFIYGNVLDGVEDQVQNQLYCKLIAMNSAHFDYEGCLFSREHMFRTDAGDQAKGLTAEGSGRVWTYLAHGLIHSYTIECNYNTSRVGNEIAPTDADPGGACVTPPSAFTTNPEKYTPSTWAGVGRACVVAILDLKGHNPCGRISKSKLKTLERVRNFVMMEVRNKREFLGKALNRDRKRQDRRSTAAAGDSRGGSKEPAGPDEIMWRRVVQQEPGSGPAASASGRESPAIRDTNSGAPTSQVLGSVSARGVNPNSCGAAQAASANGSVVMYISSKERRRRRSVAANGPLTSAAVDEGNQPEQSQLKPPLQKQLALTPTPPTHFRVASSDELISSYISSCSGGGGGGGGADGSASGDPAAVAAPSKMEKFFSGARKTTSAQPGGAVGIASGDAGRVRSSSASPSPICSGRESGAIPGRQLEVSGQQLDEAGSSRGKGLARGSGMPLSARRMTGSPRLVHKDNRKILSKELNPAGIALLMAGISPSPSESSTAAASPVVVDEPLTHALPPVHYLHGGIASQHQHQQPHGSAAGLHDLVVTNSSSSGSGSRRDLHLAHSSSSAFLPDIRKTASTDDLPHLSSVPIDSSATLNRLVAATLLQGQQAPRRNSSRESLQLGVEGGGNPVRRGSYSIKAALQLSSQYPPGSAGGAGGSSKGAAVYR